MILIKNLTIFLMQHNYGYKHKHLKYCRKTIIQYDFLKGHTLCCVVEIVVTED